MKARHTFNIKSTGFDYTKTRNIENKSLNKSDEKSDEKNDIIISVRRPTKILNEKKKNRFQKD